MKFRKRPVVIDAYQYTGGAQAADKAVAWAIKRGVGPGMRYYNLDDSIHIPTLEGPMSASPGDWIIRGVKGEFYACKPDIFELTYEPVADTAPA